MNEVAMQYLNNPGRIAPEFSRLSFSWTFCMYFVFRSTGPFYSHRRCNSNFLSSPNELLAHLRCVICTKRQR